ncbi:MAG: hypothetical protein J3Q66DRAFT_342580 [Benniella sp.]|nr:MAG: hypothetical protein J3Q66DRAFT_342580 [Benniella sp.]
MASPLSPAIRRGAQGSESMAGSSSSATLADAALMRDKTMTSWTPDEDEDSPRRGKAVRRSPPLLASSSLSSSSFLEQFSKDVQAHATDMTFHTNLSSSPPVRKRKHSDDPTTAAASRASSPHASPLSHSASTSSTPPSSIPSVSGSPRSVKPLYTDDSEYVSSDAERANGHLHQTKRRRVSSIDEDVRNRIEAYARLHQTAHPIVIGDEEYDHQDLTHSRRDYPEDEDNDASSTQANDDGSVVEFYRGSPEPSVISSAISIGTSRREPSPVVSQLSGDSDETITPRTVRQMKSRSRSPTGQQRTSASRGSQLRATHSYVDVEEEHGSSSRRDDPEVEEVIEVIDLTRPARRSNYPRGDSLPRVPGLIPQHSFQLPTLQRLVSRSSESMERSQQRRSTQTLSPVDVHEIPDDDDDEENGGDHDTDRFGSNTVRIDNEVHEVQLDPHHPWARGPIQLIMSPEPPEVDQYVEDQRQRRLEDAVILEDHIEQLDYDDHESENEARRTESQEREQEQERVEIDDGVTDEQVQSEVNSILNLVRDVSPWLQQSRTPQARTPQARSPSFEARSHGFEARTFSFEARPSPFPTTSSRSTTPGSRTTHRFSPVARRPTPVPLILRDSPQPRARSTRSPSISLNQANGSSSSSLGKGTLKQAAPVLLIKEGQDTEKQEVLESWYMENLRCSICMEVLEVPTMIKCGHVFCRGCIDKAMESSRVCPMCRNPVNRSKMIELEFMLKDSPVHGGSSSAALATATSTTTATTSAANAAR